MKVQNNLSFRGRVIPPDDSIVGVGHLLTEKVQGAMHKASTGSTLQVEEGRFLDRCKVIFTAPDGAFSLALRGVKRALNEGQVLDLIKQGDARK